MPHKLFSSFSAICTTLKEFCAGHHKRSDHLKTSKICLFCNNGKFWLQADFFPLSFPHHSTLSSMGPDGDKKIVFDMKNSGKKHDYFFFAKWSPFCFINTWIFYWNESVLLFSFLAGDMFIVHNELGDGWLWVTSMRTGESGIVVEDLVKPVVGWLIKMIQ